MNKILSSREAYEKKKKAGLDYDMNMEYREECDVQNGSWILITRSIWVEEKCRPVLYGIYWGIPYRDSYDRQCCKIHTTEDVVILNHEYTILDEEKVKQHREMGWELHECGKVANQMNMELIEQGRSLVEEEREVIWALQLDGLTEEQSCEEYFLSKHTDYNNYTICYLPSKDIFNELVCCFGKK